MTEEEAPAHIVVERRPDLGRAAHLCAGAATADNILITPPPHGGDNESDTQVALEGRCCPGAHRDLRTHSQCCDLMQTQPAET